VGMQLAEAIVDSVYGLRRFTRVYYGPRRSCGTTLVGGATAAVEDADRTRPDVGAGAVALDESRRLGLGRDMPGAVGDRDLSRPPDP